MYNVPNCETLHELIILSVLNIKYMLFAAYVKRGLVKKIPELDLWFGGKF